MGERLCRSRTHYAEQLSLVFFFSGSEPMVYVATTLKRLDGDRTLPLPFGRVPAVGEFVEVDDDVWVVTKLVHTPHGQPVLGSRMHDPRFEGGFRQLPAGSTVAAIWLEQAK